jgi:hypothetical protein
LSQPGSGYPTPHIVVLFVSYDLRREVAVCFVDIGGILKPAQIFKSSMFSRTVSLLYSGSGLLNLSFHQRCGFGFWHVMPIIVSENPGSEIC